MVVNTGSTIYVSAYDCGICSRSSFLQTWSSKLDTSSKGLNYRLFKDSISLETYFIKLPRTLLMHLGKLRTGNHRFPCERGRWQGLDLSERKYLLCNRQEIGDEFHYIDKNVQ